MSQSPPINHKLRRLESLIPEIPRFSSGVSSSVSRLSILESPSRNVAQSRLSNRLDSQKKSKTLNPNHRKQYSYSSLLRQPVDKTIEAFDKRHEKLLCFKRRFLYDKEAKQKLKEQRKSKSRLDFVPQSVSGIPQIQARIELPVRLTGLSQLKHPT